VTDTITESLRQPPVAIGLTVLAACFLGYAIAAERTVLIALPFLLPLLLVAFLHPIVALAAMLIFVPLEGLASLMPGTFTLPRLLGFLAFACFAANTFVTHKPIRNEASANWFGLLVVWMFFTSFWAHDRAATYQLTVVMVQLYLLYILCENLLDTPGKLRLGVAAYLGGAAISSLLAMQNFVSANYATSTLSRVSSIEDMNPNDFGRMVGIGLLLSLWLLFDSSSKWLRAAVLGIFPILLVALVLSKGRGAWLGFLVAVLLVFLRVRKTVQVWAAAGLIVILTVGTGIAGYQLGYFDDTLNERWAETVDSDDPTSTRVDIWRVGWVMAKDNIIVGVGFNNFKTRFNDYLHQVHTSVFPGFNKDAHNIFLSMFAETGLVGITMFGAIFFVVLRTIYRAGRNWDATIALALVAFSLIAGLSGTDYIRKYFWISIVVGILLARRTHAPAHREPALPAP
jgi:O-antigen ligase